MKIELKFSCREKLFHVEIPQLDFKEEYPATVVSYLIDGKRVILSIGVSEHELSKDPYFRFEEFIKNKKPIVGNPFEHNKFHLDICESVLRFYFLKKMREHRKKVPEYFRDVVIFLLDKATVFLDIEDFEKVPKNKREEFVSTVKDIGFVSNLKTGA